MSIAPALSLSPAEHLPPGAAALTREIHIWVLPAPAGRDLQTNRWLDLLSTDEIARAGRFHFGRHAAVFAANRARLRILLGHYIDQDPASVVFDYGPQGKPELSGFSGMLSFNFSHTDGAALVAFTSGRRIGIDIELRRSLDDLLDVARQSFSVKEVNEIQSCGSREEQQAAFYNCWTRKEAFLKGLGDGLTRPLDQFSVSCSAPPRLIDCEWDEQAPDRWRIDDVDISAALPGYAAALACEQCTPSYFAMKIFNGAQV